VQDTFAALHARFGDIATSTTNEQAALEIAYALYRVDEERFNADVAASNARGGANQTEYDAFTIRARDLGSRFGELKLRESALQDRVTRLNALADMLNALSAGVNAFISRFNTTLAAREEFQEGLYLEVRGERTITIYEYADKTALVRALAHEFGHALGIIEHATDPAALMYRENATSTLVLAPADTIALRAICPAAVR
jgi:hypothetical protein